MILGIASPLLGAQWSTRDEIEKTVRAEIPIGTSKDDVKAYFKKQKMDLRESSELPKTRDILVVTLKVKNKSMLMAAYVGVGFVFDKTQKLEAIEIVENTVGP